MLCWSMFSAELLFRCCCCCCVEGGGGEGGLRRGGGGEGRLRRGGGGGLLRGGVGGLFARWMQQGPVQVLNFLRSLDDFNCEHLTWSHPLHLLHSIKVPMILFVHTVQFQVGPGFCSMPARIRSSRIRHAGVALLFVGQIKNSV